jgi:hypothetical protein
MSITIFLRCQALRELPLLRHTLCYLMYRWSFMFDHGAQSAGLRFFSARVSWARSKKFKSRLSSGRFLTHASCSGRGAKRLTARLGHFKRNHLTPPPPWQARPQAIYRSPQKNCQVFGYLPYPQGVKVKVKVGFLHSCCRK